LTVYDENGVPVVYRGEGQRLGLSQPLEQFDPDESLLGESVVIHCKALAAAPDEQGRVSLGHRRREPRRGAQVVHRRLRLVPPAPTR
jgi:hypothetical protein